jgi:phage shock protein C
MNKKLYRSRKDRMIWGVCGGIAKYFNIDTTLVRILFAISLIFGILGFWVYIIMAIIVPLEPLQNESIVVKQ